MTNPAQLSNINSVSATQPLFELKTETTWLGRWVEWAADQTQWAVKQFSHSSRSFFYETEYEILASTVQNDQLVRSTKSWFFTSDREKIYALSSSPWKLLYNIFKQFYLEGLLFSRSNPQNALQVAKLTPSVLLERATEIHETFLNKLTDLKKAYLTALEQNNGVLSEKTARNLYQSLKDLFSATQRDVSEMDVYGNFQSITDTLLRSIRGFFNNNRNPIELQRNRVYEVQSTLERFLQHSFNYASQVKGLTQIQDLPKTPEQFDKFFEQVEENSDYITTQLAPLKDIVATFKSFN